MNTEQAMREALGQVDLSRFADVAAHLLPEPVTLALIHQGEVVSSTGDGDAAELVAALGADAPDWRDHREARCYTAGPVTLTVFGVAPSQAGGDAHMTIAFGNTDALDADQMVGVLKPLFDCVQAEIKMADEIIVMADELTARYEELNLVYDTEDQAAGFEETQSQLKTLVDNCRSYLNVSFSALVLRDKEMTWYDVADEVSAPEVQVTLEALKGQMYSWVAAVQQIAVVNDVNDRLGAVLCPNVPFKVIAAPILTGGKETSGMLLVGRTYAQPNFVNGDKNLMDVMARKAAKIIEASFDAQTGFMKRTGMEFLVKNALETTRTAERSQALFLVDVDRIQVINDSQGYDAGDLVIEQVARTIQDCVRSHDAIARTGGDEFSILIDDCNTEVAAKIARKICSAIEQLDLTWSGKRVETTASVGVTLINADSTSVDGVIAAAEVACSAVKDRGGNGINVYHAGDEELVRRLSHMDLVGRIQDTLRADRFELMCQPIVPLDGSAEVHGEVLIRMRGEDGQLISPGLFLPAAERYHLMPAIDRWVVARTLTMLESCGLPDLAPDAVISLNLSGQTLDDQGFYELVDKLMDRTRVPAHQICFEVTETSAIADIGHAQRFIRRFRKRGVRFSLDDFGTGLSSFAYLRQLEVDYLKIDGSFVKEICDDPIAATMVKAINEVGHTMGLKTIGEFVENDAIRDALAETGVNYGQGYGLGKPIPMQEFLDDVVARFSVRDAG